MSIKQPTVKGLECFVGKKIYLKDLITVVITVIMWKQPYVEKEEDN
jgi:hypothetical protein